MTKIDVFYGWEPMEPVTVRGGGWVDGIFDQDWCNHAGAEEEEVVYWPGTDLEEVRYDFFCDKCGAVETEFGWEKL